MSSDTIPPAPSDLQGATDLVEEGPDPQHVLRRPFIKGIAILLPLVVTLLVISFVLGFIYRQLTPLVGAVVQTGLLDSQILVAVITVVIFLLAVLIIHVSRERVVEVDLTVEQGICSIVTSGVAIGRDDTLPGKESGVRDFVRAEEGERIHRVDGNSLSLSRAEPATEEAKRPSDPDADE